MKNNYVAIMAGGIGSRFWPASSEEKPKQFLDILGKGKSFLQITYERFEKNFLRENIFIVTNSKYRDLIKAQIKGIGDNRIITEPSRNNTAPSVAYTAFKIHNLNPDANIVMAPSDHVIEKDDVFNLHIQEAIDFVSKNDALLTLGIEPSRPDTGYGYIKKDAEVGDNLFKVHSFKEKPNLETAKKYLKLGEYLWNAGIFVWSSKSILQAFKVNAPQIYDTLAKGEKHYNTETEHIFINENYPLTDKISVDYAIMEKADNVYTIPADIGWYDLGTWNSLHSYLNKDDNGNVSPDQNTKLISSRDNIISVPKGKKVVVKDLKGYIVVDSNDTLLIYPKDKEQEIKDIQSQM